MVEIRRFDPNRLEDLAKDQMAIYNADAAENPDFTAVKVENIIERFRRESFDRSGMFYAYEGEKMVGYSGLADRNTHENSRGMGYPWLLKETTENVRDLLYTEMEKKCLEDGIKKLVYFCLQNASKQAEFFKNKGFEIAQEFLVHEKKISYTDFELPSGYEFRSIVKEDLPLLEEVSHNDPNIRSPFIAAHYEQYMNSSSFDPESVVIAEKDGKVVACFALVIPPDPNLKKAYLGLLVVHGNHQEIGIFLMNELENRALARGKEKIEVTFYPDSPRLPFALAHGYSQYEHKYQLEKRL
ncbi:MAG: GNAT family N-acetyltransferase [Candidatus Hodarchaeales archaeon]|jgi:N-acetylglutamate synthase-like GNAT family acetyltransferase